MVELVLLHGGAEVTLVEYLLRLLAHLLAFGAVAISVYLVVAALDAIRSTMASEPG